MSFWPAQLRGRVSRSRHLPIDEDASCRQLVDLSSQCDTADVPSSRLSAAPHPPKAAETRELRNAGRGGLAITAAKLYFILVGLAQQVALKAMLGLDHYGALSSALSAASIAYNPLVATALQGVSHAVATSNNENPSPALRGALRIHRWLAIAVATAFLLLAPDLGDATGAPHIVPALRWLSAVLLVYGLYAPLVGSLNGATRFVAQARLDTVAATLRTIGLVGGASVLGRFTGGVVSGAALGFALSSLLILAIAARVHGASRSVAQSASTDWNWRTHCLFVAPIIASQLLLNLLFQSDQLLLRRFAADAASANGFAPTAADRLVGAYRAIQLFCFLPYQLVVAIGIVVFPLIAKAQRENRKEEVGRCVLTATRLALLVTGAIVCVTAGIPEAVLNLVFGRDTAVLGAEAMRTLAPGLSALALLGLLTSILNSLRAPKPALVVTGLAVLFVGALMLLLVRGQDFKSDLLVQTARATSIGLVFATFTAAGLVRKRVGCVLDPLRALRIASCTTVTVLIARQVPVVSPLGTLPLSAGLVLLYVLLLLGTRELGLQDWKALRARAS